MTNALSIKGTRDGLTITMSTGDYGVLIAELAAHLRTQGQFFRGGRVAVRLGGRLVTREDLERLATLLEEHQMVLRTVITSDEQTASAAQGLGLHILSDSSAAPPLPSATEAPSAPDVTAEPRQPPERAPLAQPEPPAAGQTRPAEDAAAALGLSPASYAVPPPVVEHAAVRAPAAASPGQPVQATASESDRAFLIRRNVRSGQVVHHTGHVVIVGDVNPGAEVWATGDVIIWGRLRGTVRAGSSGNSDAVICALEMRPSQLRIGDAIARPADSDGRARPYAEVARVRNGVVVVEPWASGRGA